MIFNSPFQCKPFYDFLIPVFNMSITLYMSQMVLDIIYMHLWIFIFIGWSSIKMRKKAHLRLPTLYADSQSLKQEDWRLKLYFPKIHISILPNKALFWCWMLFMLFVCFSDKCPVHDENDTYRSPLKSSNRDKLMFSDFFLILKKKIKKNPIWATCLNISYR